MSTPIAVVFKYSRFKKKNKSLEHEYIYQGFVVFRMLVLAGLQLLLTLGYQLQAAWPTSQQILGVPMLECPNRKIIAL